MDVTATLSAPPRSGRYRLVVDMVAEGICWFEERGSLPLSLALEVVDGAADNRIQPLLRAEIHWREARTLRAACGTLVAVPLSIRNTGTTPWPHAPEPCLGHVALGARLRHDNAPAPHIDLLRSPLPHDVGPGAQVELTCAIPVPSVPGRYVVEVDMVDEGKAWFASGGSRPLTIDLIAV